MVFRCPSLPFIRALCIAPITSNAHLLYFVLHFPTYPPWSAPHHCALNSSESTVLPWPNWVLPCFLIASVDPLHPAQTRPRHTPGPLTLHHSLPTPLSSPLPREPSTFTTAPHTPCISLTYNSSCSHPPSYRIAPPTDHTIPFSPKPHLPLTPPCPTMPQAFFTLPPTSQKRLSTHDLLSSPSWPPGALSTPNLCQTVPRGPYSPWPWGRWGKVCNCSPPHPRRLSVAGLHCPPASTQKQTVGVGEDLFRLLAMPLPRETNPTHLPVLSFMLPWLCCFLQLVSSAAINNQGNGNCSNLPLRLTFATPSCLWLLYHYRAQAAFSLAPPASELWAWISCEQNYLLRVLR